MPRSMRCKPVAIARASNDDDWVTMSGRAVSWSWRGRTRTAPTRYPRGLLTADLVLDTSSRLRGLVTLVEKLCQLRVADPMLLGDL